MQLITNWLENNGKKVGLKISVNMTKIQKIGDLEEVIVLEELHWKSQGNFTCMGSIQSKVVEIRKDVKSRITEVCSVFGQLHADWGSKVISLKITLQLYTSNVPSTNLYACETWKVTTKIINLLDIHHLSFYQNLKGALSGLK